MLVPLLTKEQREAAEASRRSAPQRRDDRRSEPLPAFVDESTHRRVVREMYVPRADLTQGDVRRTEVITNEGYRYVRDETDEPENAPTSNRTGRERQRVASSSIHELYEDAYEENRYTTRNISEEERQDLGRAMQDKILAERERLVRMGLLPPPGSVSEHQPAHHVHQAPSASAMSTGRMLRSNRSQQYPMFQPKEAPTAVQLVRARENPMLCFFHFPAYTLLCQHKFLLAVNTMLPALVKDGTAAGLPDWDSICKGAGLYKAPPAEQPDMGSLRTLPGHPFVGQLQNCVLQLYRFSKLNNESLHSLLNGASNEAVALQQVALEEAVPDTFQAWIEDHVRTMLVLQLASPGTYRLFAYYCTL